MLSHQSFSPLRSSNRSDRKQEHLHSTVTIGMDPSIEPNSNLNSEPEIIEDKPPSPLSLQQDGAFSLVQSPPFESDQLDCASENAVSNVFSDSKIRTSNNLSEVVYTIIDQKQKHLCHRNMLDSNSQNAIGSDQVNSLAGDISSLSNPDVLQSFQESRGNPRNSSLQKCITEFVAPPLSGSRNAVIALPTRETIPSCIASRKSVKELYGQPSWWGDGDNDYTYPHTSSFGNQETLQPVVTLRKYSMQTDINASSKENSTRPPPEAFVVDFGSSKPRLERPASLSGSLSQCVPPKLRQGLDERERKKREKQLVVKQQSTSEVVSKNTVTTTSISKSNATTTSTVNRINSKTHSRGASLSTRGSAARTATTMTTTTTTTITSVRSSITTPNRNPRVPLTKSNKPTTNKADSSLILRTGRIDSSTNLTSTSTNASRSNLTDRSRGRFSYQTSYKESTQSSKANVKPPFSVGGRRVSAGAASLTSQRTVPSQLNRSKASLQTRGSVPPSNTGLTDSRSNIRGASSATRQTITQRRGVNRGFMTPTTSSDAKQVKVKESIRSVPNESPISSSPKCDSRRTYESPIGNSAKKPVTSTFLRRGTIQGCRNGGISRKFSTDNINQYSLNPNKSSSTCISDLTASVVATIEAYDDPKAYLFYRMFQGSEEIEATTGGIFQAFSPYSFNFKQNFSSEFNSNEQLNVNSQSYEIDEQFPNFQTNYVHNESMKQSSSLSLSQPPQQQQQQPSLPSQKSTDIQNKHTEMSISTDDEETPYQDLPSDCFDLTTTSTSMNRPLTEKTSLYTSKCYKNDIETNFSTCQAQNIIEASIVNNSKVHCTVIDNNDKLTDPTLKSMNLSMLVSTSVTSLTPSQTGTYIIDGVGGDDDNNNVDDKNINDEDLLQHSDRQNIHFSNDNDLSTPRGSPVISDSGEEESSKHQQTIKLPLHVKNFENSMSFSVEHVNTCLTNQYSLKKRLNDTISTVDLTKTSLNENSIEFMRTGSNVCLTKNRDDSKNKRTGLQATDDLEDSDVVGASLTSLTPSHAGTYILDIDDTLVAQGILPVIIRSHETLASSLTDSGLNTESMNTHAVENATPRGGSPTFKEKLWNVVETDESKDDLLLMTSVASKFDQVGGPYNVSVDFDNDELTAQLKMESLRAEFEDTYKLLPSPNQFLNAMNTVDSSFSESESHTSQMKTTTYSVHGKECIRTIPLVVNTSNTSSLQSMNYFAKPTLLSSTSLTNCTQVVVSSNSTLQNDLITTVQSKANIVSCPHKDGMHSTVHLNPTVSVSHQTSINLKLPDNSLSTSSSSDNPSTSSSCSNHVLKSNMEVFNGSDLNNQNIEHITMMYNINDDSVLNEHHSAYNNVYIKRRNSEIHNQSQFQSNDQHNSNNFIPSNGNHLYNLSENIGNNCHITISRRRDSEIIKDQQMINSNYYTKMTTTPSSSSVLRDQLLARLHSMPTAYNSRPNRIQNMNRTHSYNRRRSQQYPHGSASVPDPASPVRSWSSISSGTDHSLTNKIDCKSRKQLYDQTDSGFIETSDLLKVSNKNKRTPKNSSPIFLSLTKLNKV